MKSVHARLAILALALGAACATPPKRVGKPYTWPPAPEVGRIRFVTSFADSDNIDPSRSRFWRFLTGGRPEIGIRAPFALALSNDGQRLYITESTTASVLVADIGAKTLGEFAPRQLVGKPSGLAVDAADNVYVANAAAGTVAVLNPRGALIRTLGAEHKAERALGLAIDQERDLLYVVDGGLVTTANHRVLVFKTGGEFVRTIGIGRGSADGAFNFPSFASVDSRGRLFVTDTMNFRVQVFDPEGNFIGKFGEVANFGAGTFQQPKGIAHDGFDISYVVDGENAVVQLFNPSFQPLMYFGGRVPALEFLDSPLPIAIDRRTNRIYVGNTLGLPRINVYELINTTASDVSEQASPPSGG